MNTKVLLTIFTFLILTSFAYSQVYVDNTTEFILDDTNVAVTFYYPITLSQVIVYNDSITLDAYTLKFIPASAARTNITITNFALADLQFTSASASVYSLAVEVSPVPYGYPLPTRGATRTSVVYYRSVNIENNSDGVFSISSNASNNLVRIVTTESGAYSKCLLTSDPVETVISLLPLLIVVLVLGFIIIVVKRAAEGKQFEFDSEGFRDAVMMLLLVCFLLGIGMIVMTAFC